VSEIEKICQIPYFCTAPAPKQQMTMPRNGKNDQAHRTEIILVAAVLDQIMTALA
jgi:hypothetical protein